MVWSRVYDVGFRLMCASVQGLGCRVPERVWGTTEGPTWGHPMLVLGAVCSFLEPFCGHLSPKLDKVP